MAFSAGPSRGMAQPVTNATVKDSARALIMFVGAGNKFQLLTSMPRKMPMHSIPCHRHPHEYAKEKKYKTLNNKQ
jgi:hypothetical protein